METEVVKSKNGLKIFLSSEKDLIIYDQGKIEL